MKPPVILDLNTIAPPAIAPPALAPKHICYWVRPMKSWFQVCYGEDVLFDLIAHENRANVIAQQLNLGTFLLI